MTVKLIKNLKFFPEKALPYKRKNFCAVIFFDFFWKGEKIMSLPQYFSIVPWGLTRTEKNSIEDNDIFFPKKCPGIRHFDVEENKYFYLGIDHSIGSDWNNTLAESLFYLQAKFFNHLPDRKIIQGTGATDFRSNKILYSFSFSSSTLEKFSQFLENRVGIFIKEEGEKVINNILSVLEKEKGKVQRLESRNESNAEDLGTEDLIFNFLNHLDVNFCSDVPLQKKIHLEQNFSEEELISFFKQVKNFDLGSNPFRGNIEDSIEEYKEYLLTLFGPGKWEYSNLEIETLNLSIEELVCLNIICHSFMASGAVAFSFSEPLFFSTENTYGLWYKRVPYMYFWYRLKEVVTNKN